MPKTTNRGRLGLTSDTHTLTLTHTYTHIHTHTYKQTHAHTYIYTHIDQWFPNVFGSRTTFKNLVVREGQNIDLYQDSRTTSANLADH